MLIFFAPWFYKLCPFVDCGSKEDCVYFFLATGFTGKTIQHIAIHVNLLHCVEFINYFDLVIKNKQIYIYIMSHKNLLFFRRLPKQLLKCSRLFLIPCYYQGEYLSDPMYRKKYQVTVHLHAWKIFWRLLSCASGVEIPKFRAWWF